jgi:hypothetical protein
LQTSKLVFFSNFFSHVPEGSCVIKFCRKKKKKNLFLQITFEPEDKKCKGIIWKRKKGINFENKNWCSKMTVHILKMSNLQNCNVKYNYRLKRFMKTQKLNSTFVLSIRIWLFKKVYASSLSRFKSKYALSLFEKCKIFIKISSLQISTEQLHILIFYSF